MKDARIHIVIPTFNRAEVFKVVGPQYYGNLPHVERIVVVNDASTDDTEKMVQEWAERDPRVVLYSAKEHIGLPQGRNVGIEHCEGTHIMFGEDDKIFEPDATAVMLEEMERVDADLIACSLFQLDESVKEIGQWEEHQLSHTPHYLDDRYLYGHYDASVPDTMLATLVDACFLAKAEVFDNIRYDLSLGFDHFREETDVQLTAWEQGFKVAFTPKTRCYHMPRWMRSGGCFAGRPKGSPLRDHLQRFVNNHKMWNKHHGILKKLNPRRSRLSAETLFLIHSLAGAGFEHVSRLKADDRKLLAAALWTALSPAAALEVVTTPPAGYGSKGIEEL